VNICEGESVNRSQMDTGRKTCCIRTWEKYLFLDISSTYIDTLIQSLYQCVETRRIEVVWLLSHFCHFCTSVSTSSSAKRLPPICEPFYATNTSHRKQETFLYEYLWIESFCPQKRRTEHCSSVVHSSCTVAVLTTETSLWTCAYASDTETVIKLDCAANYLY
jgi:hypothetical protein